eukprot:snap_masked-scaffold_1-processed-gene-17.46-mRNA-1 protein AED:1.00 eAED:1.00 QI:0/0/0/0/1/1/2/0/66
MNKALNFNPDESLGEAQTMLGVFGLCLRSPKKVEEDAKPRMTEVNFSSTTYLADPSNTRTKHKTKI